MRLHALLHQRLPRLVDDVELREQSLPIAIGEIKRDLDLAQSGKGRLIIGALRIGWVTGDGKNRDYSDSDKTDSAHVFLPVAYSEQGDYMTAHSRSKTRRSQRFMSPGPILQGGSLGLSHLGSPSLVGHRSRILLARRLECGV